MNNQRRKELKEIANQLESLKEELITIQEQEEDAFENLPESLQLSMQGELMQEKAENISDAVFSLDECIDNIMEAIEQEGESMDHDEFATLLVRHGLPEPN